MFISSIVFIFSNILKQPNGELLVAVNHNHLRRVESETVDPIDSSYPPTLMGSTPWGPELHVLPGVNAGYKSQELLQHPGCEHASIGMPGQRTACAATHGIKEGQ